MNKARFFGGLTILLTVLCLSPSAGWGATKSVTCSKAGDLQVFVNSANPGDTLTVTGPCIENLVIPARLDNLTLRSSATLPATETITATDTTKPVITILAQGVVVDGFTIENGSQGITVTNLASANVENNTIQNNMGAGVAVNQTSDGHIGYQPGNPPTLAPNTFIGNKFGVQVGATSSATILDNTFTSSTIDDILVNGNSHANIAGNTINGSVNGIFVTEFSGVSLAGSGASSPFNDFNTTTPAHKNSNLGVACGFGGYADGYLGTVAGVHGGAFLSSTTTVCVNNLQFILTGSWDVSGSAIPVSTGNNDTLITVTFDGGSTTANGVTSGNGTVKFTSSATGKTTTNSMTWAYQFSGAELSITVLTPAILLEGTISSFSNSDHFTFTVNDVDGESINVPLSFTRQQ
jgi:hypothetical protein